MNRLFRYHAIFTQFLQRPSRIPILAIDARLCLFHPRADEARVPPEQRTGLRACLKSRMSGHVIVGVMTISTHVDKLYDTDLTDAAWALIAPMLPADVRRSPADGC